MTPKIIGWGYLLIGIAWFVLALLGTQLTGRLVFQLVLGFFFVTAGLSLLRQPRRGSEDGPPSIR